MVLASEIRAIRERDPASRTTLEILLTYPGLHAIALHRLAAVCHRRGLKLSARIISHINRFVTGIEIHPGAQIGRGLFIDHGFGVVIGETTIIGDNVTLYQGVTLGGTGKERGKRHPTLGNGVVVGVGAKILGAVTVGDGAKIGAGAVVLRDVPPHTTAVGVPAHAVRFTDPDSGESRRLERLPDPQWETVFTLVQRVEELEQRLREMEKAQAEALAEREFVS